MKDAAWRRYALGRCLATFDPEISEWGNPSAEEAETPAQAGERTQGSKTFQYLEEKRQICIPLIAASEKGEAQTSYPTQVG